MSNHATNIHDIVIAFRVEYDVIIILRMKLACQDWGFNGEGAYALSRLRSIKEIVLKDKHLGDNF